MDTIPEGPIPSDSTGCVTCPRCHSVVSPAQSQACGMHKACFLSVVESEIDIEARFETEQFCLTCAGACVGTKHKDAEKHALFWRFKRVIAKWRRVVEDRDAKIQAFSSVLKAQGKALDSLRAALYEAIESIPNGELSEERKRLRRIADGEIE